MNWLRICDYGYNALTLVKAAVNKAIVITYTVWIGVLASVLGGVITFLVISSMGWTEAPPSAVLEAPRWLEEQIGWVARAAEYWCRSQAGCAD